MDHLLWLGMLLSLGGFAFHGSVSWFSLPRLSRPFSLGGRREKPNGIPGLDARGHNGWYER
jgi:hypothetical protein